MITHYSNATCTEKAYDHLQLNLQIQRSALLDNVMLRAGNLKSGSVFSKGFYHIKATACGCMKHVH